MKNLNASFIIHAQTLMSLADDDFFGLFDEMKTRDLDRHKWVQQIKKNYRRNKRKRLRAK